MTDELPPEKVAEQLIALGVRITPYYEPTCPCCKSDQVEVCLDTNNLMKTTVRCRICKIGGPLASWNKRPTMSKSVIKRLFHQMTGSE